MKFKSAYAENYGIIRDRQNFVFEDGINLILGKNGTGKSTVPKLLKLCLFNECDKTLKDEINWDSDFFKIGLVWEHLNNNYQIDIEYDGKVTNRILRINNDGSQELKGQDAIDYLTDNFNPNIFQIAMFAMQGEIDIITQKPADKRIGMQKVYDIEFKNEIKNIEALIESKQNNDLKDIEKEIYRLNNIEYDIKELKDLPFDSQLYENYKNKLDNINSQLTLLQNDIDQYQVISDNITVQTNNHLKIEQQQQALSLDITKIEKEINDLIQINDNINSDEEIQKKIDEVNRSVILLNDKITQLKKSYDDIHVLRIADWSKVDDLSNLYIDLANIKVQITNNKLKEIMWKKGVCNECQTKFDHSADEIQKLSNEIVKQENEKQVIEQKISDLKKEEQDHNKVFKENEDNKNKRIIIQKDIESVELQIKNQIQTLEDNKKVIADNCKKLKEKNIEIIESRKENLKNKKENIQEKLEQLLKIEKEINDLEVKKSKLNIDENKKAIIEKEKENYQKLTDSYFSVFSENNLILTNNKLLEQKKIDDQLTLKSNELKRDQIVNEINDLNKSLIVLKKELPSYIISKLISGVERDMNCFIDKIYDRNLNVQIKEIKDGIHIHYGNKGVSEKASGIEKQLMNLSYKDSLNKKKNIGVLVLDEMDCYAEVDNAIKLYEMFGSMREIYNQLIIITHNEMAKNLLRNNYQANVIEMDRGRII